MLGKPWGSPGCCGKGLSPPGGKKKLPERASCSLGRGFGVPPCCPFCLSLQSYQQFSLTIAVVATMLLEKEPSMEAALGLALRANLRQVRTHHLQELEDFINSYDSGTPSP